MSTTVVLLPADASAETLAVRVDAQGQVLTQDAANALHAPAARTLLMVPGSAVHLRWMTLPDRSLAQSVSAARLQLAEHLATDAQALHVVIAAQAEPDGTRLVAAVDTPVMQQWLERAARVGVAPDVVVPDCLLLDEVQADQAPTVVQWDGRWLLRAPRLACSLEPPLAQLLIAAQPIAAALPPDTDPLHAIAQFARHAAAAPLNLRQHAFAAQPQKRSGFSSRTLAALLAVLVISPLLLLLAQTLRYEIGAQLLQRRATAMLGTQASAGAPQSRHLAPSATAFATELATLVSAVDAIPGAELDALTYNPAGPLRATLLHGDAAQLRQLSAQLSAAGWQMRPGTSQSQDDRVRTPMELEPPR